MKNITDKVNTGRSECNFDISKVEEKYNAKFVGRLCLKTHSGNWQEDSCADIYWQATPPVEGYSNYFGLIIQCGSAYIISGASAVEGILNGVIADDGEIIYSRYRHDMRYSSDRSVWIDGGRDYVRGGMHGKYIIMKIVDGEFFEVEPTDSDYPVDN